ncbi:hypothetical protein [Phascolarctobacterium faecium]|uniref:hypothetical protein n=1 Tax=Phascolarctobacterium faecium TaxID=33025 RepID=UPI003AB6E944
MNNLEKLVQELGTPYTITTIDNERVLYCNINQNYEIEVSGLDNMRAHPSIVVYVWQKSPKIKCVETLEGIHSTSLLADTLVELRHKYSLQ